MFGIIRENDNRLDYGIVESRDRTLGTIRVYNLPDFAEVGMTVEFEDIVSKRGNTYGRYISLPERNNTIFNTEDRKLWYEWGSNKEDVFVEEVAPMLGLDIIINPEKLTNPTVIDLYDRKNNVYCDLKVQDTPFFTAHRYKYLGAYYNPTYTVTFNQKDYENYKTNYDNPYIFFWVNWQQLEGYGTTVEPINGIWRASFNDMALAIEKGKVHLHNYIHRVNDDFNAKNSYLFSLLDTDIFEKLSFSNEG